MIPFSLISQLSLIALSVALVVTYVKPTLSEISDTQDKISLYQTEIENISRVNAKLANIASAVDSVSVDDHRRLLTYMPDTVDTIAVPRDLEAMASEAGVIVRRISYEGAIPVTPDVAGNIDSNLPEPHSFIFEFEGSYDQIKQMTSFFEVNQYPLEVKEMVVRKLDGGFLTATVKLYTYDRSLPASTLQTLAQ